MMHPLVRCLEGVPCCNTCIRTHLFTFTATPMALILSSIRCVPVPALRSRPPTISVPITSCLNVPPAPLLPPSLPRAAWSGRAPRWPGCCGRWSSTAARCCSCTQTIWHGPTKRWAGVQPVRQGRVGFGAVCDGPRTYHGRTRVCMAGFGGAPCALVATREPPPDQLPARAAPRAARVYPKSLMA